MGLPLDLRSTDYWRVWRVRLLTCVTRGHGINIPSTMPSSLFLLLLLLLSHLSSSTSAVSVLSPLLDSPYPAPPSTLHPHHLQHRNDGGPTLYVDCAGGSDTNSGTTPAAPLKTLPRAIALGGAWVEVSGGVCPLEAPVRV